MQTVPMTLESLQSVNAIYVRRADGAMTWLIGYNEWDESSAIDFDGSQDARWLIDGQIPLVLNIMKAITGQSFMPVPTGATGQDTVHDWFFRQDTYHQLFPAPRAESTPSTPVTA